MKKEAKRIKVVCAYDGTGFNGWQSQRSGAGVQDCIEEVLKKLIGGAVRIHGSGRTDAGVHALGQVFHFDGEWAYGGDALEKAMNGMLPKEVQILDAREVAVDFHARYAVKKKRYVYYMRRGYAVPTQARYCWSLGEHEFDVDEIKRAAKIFLGRHDFSGLGVTSRGSSGGNPVKEIHRSELIVKGRNIKFVTEGSGYLYKMVRRMVGGIVAVGRGKLEMKELQDVLNQQSGGRITTAPGVGLFLDRVWY